MTMIDQHLLDTMKRLDGLDKQARARWLSQVDSQRAELLSALVRQLDTSSKSVQVAAIYLIGRHRLSEGVGELVQRIDFDGKDEVELRSEPLWEQYPAMEALINIGRPSVAPALELLATDPSDLRRDLAVKVIRYAEDAEVARFIVQRAYAAEADAARKSNLKDALVRLDKLPQ